MSLTLGHGPLSMRPPDTVNYKIEGPAHKLLFQDFPRRVRAKFAKETVLDTRAGMLVFESAMLPQLYVPSGDVRTDLLMATEHQTHCPFKGDAAYWSVRVGERTADNAVWAYPSPNEQARWLTGYLSFSWEAMDSWLDEDEEVYGHLRDPYTRVDVRQSSRGVRILANDQVIAETEAPKLLTETGLPNRYYIPPEDIRFALLERSATQTYCPYKGLSTYWSLRLGDELVADVAWSYADPLENAVKAKDHVCFLHDRLTVELS